MDISACATDADLEAWRAVRIAVAPGERCMSVAELKAQESPARLLVLARRDGVVVGSGLADESDTAGGGFAMPRVVPEHRRGGVGDLRRHRRGQSATLDERRQRPDLLEIRLARPLVS